MAVPAQAFVDALEDTWDALAALCADLTDAQWQLPTGVPGWTVKDNVAHVVGLERSLMEADPSEQHVVRAPAPHVRNDFGSVTERQVDYRRGWAPEQVLAELIDLAARRVRQLREDPGVLERDAASPFGPVALQRLLPTRVFDCWAHEQDVRRALGRPGHVVGPAAERTWETVTRQLGRVLPDRLPGVSLVLEAEPLPAVHVVESGSSPVHVRAAWGELIALVCGRSDADPVALEVVSGEPEVLDVLTPALAITP